MQVERTAQPERLPTQPERIQTQPEKQAPIQPDVQVVNLLKGQMERQIYDLIGSAKSWRSSRTSWLSRNLR